MVWGLAGRTEKSVCVFILKALAGWWCQLPLFLSAFTSFALSLVILGSHNPQRKGYLTNLLSKKVRAKCPRLRFGILWASVWNMWGDHGPHRSFPYQFFHPSLTRLQYRSTTLHQWLSRQQVIASSPKGNNQSAGWLRVPEDQFKSYSERQQSSTVNLNEGPHILLCAKLAQGVNRSVARL